MRVDTLRRIGEMEKELDTAESILIEEGKEVEDENEEEIEEEGKEVEDKDEEEKEDEEKEDVLVKKQLHQ